MPPLSRWSLFAGSTSTVGTGGAVQGLMMRVDPALKHPRSDKLPARRRRVARFARAASFSTTSINVRTVSTSCTAEMPRETVDVLAVVPLTYAPWDRGYVRRYSGKRGTNVGEGLVEPALASATVICCTLARIL